MDQPQGCLWICTSNLVELPCGDKLIIELIVVCEWMNFYNECP
jgi:hypothetical protein